jgi:hypothetical protein
VPELSALPASIGIMGFFALTTLIGIRESSVVAFSIFLIHMTTLTTLSIVGIVFIAQHPETIQQNYQNITFPDVRYTPSEIDNNIIILPFAGMSLFDR